jgi:hypothetical protein
VARLDWSTPGSREYETGIDRGVLYVGAQPGVPWVGLSSVDETPSGGETKSYYIDGVKYSMVSSAEEFEATINAFTYPPEFALCDGTAQVRTGLFVTHQRRKQFGFSYRTMVGNDTEGDGHGYQIHIVYNALAAPTQKTYATTSTSTEPTTFGWSITTRPPAMAGYKRTAHVIIDSRSTDVVVLQAVEDALYGSDVATPRLLSLTELTEMYEELFDLVIVVNGDGTYTATGPSSVIQIVNSEVWQITSPAAVIIDEDTFTLTSA